VTSKDNETKTFFSNLESFPDPETRELAKALSFKCPLQKIPIGMLVQIFGTASKLFPNSHSSRRMLFVQFEQIDCPFSPVLILWLCHLAG
jgi:hypothetical protein